METPAATPDKVEKPYNKPTKFERKQDIKQAFSGHLPKNKKEEEKEGPPVTKVEPSKASIQHAKDIKESYTAGMTTDK